MSVTNNAVLGFGVSGPHGEVWFSEKKLYALVEQAIDGGVRRFDTAGFYGDAEVRLGRALRQFKDIEVSSKVGTHRSSMGRLTKDFSEAAIRTDVELSLVNLGRERLDVLYLHGPSAKDIDMAFPTIAALKSEGKVACVGVCGSGGTLSRAVRLGGIDAIMGPFNLVERGNLEVFNKAKAKRIETAAIVPLAQAIFDPNFFQIRKPADVWRVVRAVAKNRAGVDAAKTLRQALQKVEGWTPAQAALGFVLVQDAIDLVFTTTTNPLHLADSLDTSNRCLPPDAVKQLMLDVEAIAA